MMSCSTQLLMGQTWHLKHFNTFAKEKLQEHKLDEKTSEQIIKGIIDHHVKALRNDSSFYRHLVEGMQAERSDYGLTSGDKCALESNIEKAIHSGFAEIMGLNIKNSLETTVAINDLTREIRNINLRVNLVEKKVDHNSHAIVETQKTITVSKMGEAEKKLKLTGVNLGTGSKEDQKRTVTTWIMKNIHRDQTV